MVIPKPKNQMFNQMKNLYVLLVAFLPCFLTAQSYTLPFDIQNPIADPLTDQQVLLEFNSADLIADGKMQVDCDDIRIFDAPSGGSPIDFWLESDCDETVTRLWVKIPNIAGNATETVYMTYGDPVATSASDGEATFIFFDDFSSGTIDAAKWNLLANATIDNTTGQENPPSAQAQVFNANDNNLRSNINLPASNFAFHASFYDNGFSSGVNVNTWVGIAPISYLGVRNPSATTYWYDNSFANTGIARSTGWHYAEIRYTDCLERTILDHGVFDSGWFGAAGTPSYITLYSWNNNANFDNIFIRKVISDGTTCSEPIVLEGCEQTAGPGPGGVGTTDGTSNLKLWLKADAGVVYDGSNLVSEWQDQSGNCLHVSQSNAANQPLYEQSAICGEPGVLFGGPVSNGTNDFLNNTTENLMDPTHARTIFVYGDMNNASIRGGTFLTSRRTGSIFENQIYVDPFSGGTFAYSDGVNAFNNVTMSNTVFQDAKEPFYATYYTTGSNSKLNMRLNGNVVALSQSGNSNPENGATGFTIGHREDVLTNPYYGQTWDGHISEIIVFDRQLTAQEITDVETYLSDKYTTLSVGCSVLPVELLVFDGEQTSSGNLLFWKTASETDNLGFEVQKSKDAREWSTLDFVDGVGNSLEINRYEFLDKTPYGKNYYRLKQIDFNGAYSFSNIIQINNGDLNKTTIYPNPSHGQLSIAFSSEMERGETVFSFFVTVYPNRKFKL